MTQTDGRGLERLTEFFQRWSQLHPTEVAKLGPTLSRHELAKGEQLVRAGDPPNRVAFVLSGLLRAYYVTSDGAEYVRSFIPEDELAAPFASLIANEPSNLIIEALEPASLLSFDAGLLRHLMATHHGWSELGRRLAERYYLLRERHAHQLLALSVRERYCAFVEQYPQLVQRIPQKHVAGYLGLTPVSLNRVIAAMKNENPS